MLHKSSLCWLMLCWSLAIPVLIAAPLDDGLIGHWMLDDGAGDTATDHSGNGNDGTIEGQGTWMEGLVGGALDFAADAQTLVTIPDADALNPTESITLAAWVNPRSVYVGEVWQERNCVVAKARAYYLDFNGEGLVSSYIYGPQPQEWVSGTTDVSTRVGDWFHVATTYDGAEHHVYVDGKAEVSLGRQGTITVDPSALFIGYVDNDRYFDGAIDDVRLYDRALSEEEINQLITETRPVNVTGKLPVVWGQVKQQ